MDRRHLAKLSTDNKIAELASGEGIPRLLKIEIEQQSSKLSELIRSIRKRLD